MLRRAVLIVLVAAGAAVLIGHAVTAEGPTVPPLPAGCHWGVSFAPGQPNRWVKVCRP